MGVHLSRIKDWGTLCFVEARHEMEFLIPLCVYVCDREKECLGQMETWRNVGEKVYAGKFSTVYVKIWQVCYLGISMWPKGKV